MLTFMGFEDWMLQHVFIIEAGVTILVIPNGKSGYCHGKNSR